MLERGSALLFGQNSEGGKPRKTPKTRNKNEQEILGFVFFRVFGVFRGFNFMNTRTRRSALHRHG